MIGHSRRLRNRLRAATMATYVILSTMEFVYGKEVASVLMQVCILNRIVINSKFRICAYNKVHDIADCPPI